MQNQYKSLTQTRNLIRQYLSSQTVNESWGSLQKCLREQIFIIDLMKLVQADQIDRVDESQKQQIKLCSAILLKHSVKLYFEQENIYHPSFIDFIKTNIFQCFSTSHSQLHHIHPILIQIIQTIAFRQYPDQWPNLLHTLFSSLSTDCASLNEVIDKAQVMTRMYTCLRIIVEVMGLFLGSITKQHLIGDKLLDQFVELGKYLIQFNSNGKQMGICSFRFRCSFEILKLFDIQVRNVMRTEEEQAVEMLKQSMQCIKMSTNMTVLTEHSLIQSSLSLLEISSTLFKSIIASGKLNHQITKDAIDYLLNYIYQFLSKFSSLSQGIVHLQSINNICISLLDCIVGCEYMGDKINEYSQAIEFFLQQFMNSQQNIEQQLGCETVKQMDQNRSQLLNFISKICSIQSQHTNTIFMAMIQQISNAASMIQKTPQHVWFQKLEFFLGCFEAGIEFISHQNMILIYNPIQCGLGEILISQRDIAGSSQIESTMILIKVRIANILSILYAKKLSSGQTDTQAFPILMSIMAYSVHAINQSHQKHFKVQSTIAHAQLFTQCIQNLNSQCLTQNLLEIIDRHAILQIISRTLKIAECEAREDECLQILGIVFKLIGTYSLLVENLGVDKFEGEKSCLSLALNMSRITAIYTSFIQQAGEQTKATNDPVQSHFFVSKQEQSKIQISIRYGCLSLLQQIIRYFITQKNMPTLQEDTLISSLMNSLFGNFNIFISQQDHYRNYDKYLELSRDILIYKIVTSKSYNRVEQVNQIYVLYYLKEAILGMNNHNRVLLEGGEQFQFYQLDALMEGMTLTSQYQQNNSVTSVSIAVKDTSCIFSISNIQKLSEKLKLNEHGQFEATMELMKILMCSISLSGKDQFLIKEIAQGQKNQICVTVEQMLQGIINQASSIVHENQNYDYTINEKMSFIRILQPILACRLISTQIESVLSIYRELKRMEKERALNNSQYRLLLLCVRSYCSQIMFHQGIKDLQYLISQIFHKSQHKMIQKIEFITVFKLYQLFSQNQQVCENLSEQTKSYIMSVTSRWNQQVQGNHLMEEDAMTNEQVVGLSKKMEGRVSTIKLSESYHSSRKQKKQIKQVQSIFKGSIQLRHEHQFESIIDKLLI